MQSLLAWLTVCSACPFGTAKQDAISYTLIFMDMINVPLLSRLNFLENLVSCLILKLNITQSIRRVIEAAERNQ